MLDIDRIRSYFPAILSGRIVTNNAASTQIPSCLIELYKKLSVTYENVHRGQSSASKKITEIFENSYETIANFIGANSKKSIILYRNATEAANAIMYSLLTEFKDGDNIVTTYLEHNSNYVPWYGLTHEILPKFGMKVECRLTKFDKETGEIDLEHMNSLVDRRTKIICCTGASNFLGTKQPISKIRKIARGSEYRQPNGIGGSYLLIDGSQLVPNSFVDVKKDDIDFLMWSFHKMLAPVGIGALYVKEEILESMRPFLYGGDMIAEGQVSPKYVGYNELPWKFTAGTPNILGTIISAEAIKFLVNIALNPKKEYSYNTSKIITSRSKIKMAMDEITKYERKLTQYMIDNLLQIPGLTIYGPKDAKRKVPLVSFNIKNKTALQIAEELNKKGIESRAACHCATLAHYFYGIKPHPPASCRLSFYIYNTMEELKYIVEVMKSLFSPNSL